MALDAMRKAYATDEVRELIEVREKAMHDEATRLAQAKKDAHRGTAAKMLAKGIDRATVLAITELEPDDLPNASDG